MKRILFTALLIIPFLCGSVDAFDTGHGGIRLLGGGKVIRSKPLKTGQTTSYFSGTTTQGDDGYLEKGEAHDYKVYTTGQYAGTTQIITGCPTGSGASVYLSNNTVYDRKTGLMWTRYFPMTGVGPSEDGLLLWEPSGVSHFQTIYQYEYAANTAKLAGHNDWRVPNLFELLTIFDLELSSPAIDATYFPSVPANNYFWTSTTDPFDHSKAFAPKTRDAYSSAYAKTNALYVLLVRSVRE